MQSCRTWTVEDGNTSSFPSIKVVFCLLSPALCVFCQPHWGQASRRPPGPGRSLPAAFCQPAVQSNLLVDEHLHHLCTQTTHWSEGHREAAHRHEGPHQLHQAAQGLRGSEGEFRLFSEEQLLILDSGQWGRRLETVEYKIQCWWVWTKGFQPYDFWLLGNWFEQKQRLN